MKKIPRNVDILFVGDHDRGKQIQETLKSYGWNIIISKEKNTVLNECVSFLPDLVILDDFPESRIARSAYYHPCFTRAVPFLALNDSPNDLKFFHVNALLFLKIINRDPEQNDIVNAVIELLESKQKMYSWNSDGKCLSDVSMRDKSSIASIQP